MSNRLKGRRKFLILFQKDPVRRKPVLETQICHGFLRTLDVRRKATRLRHANLHVMQKMVEALH